MEVCALASGSSGNCFYIASRDSAVLVDAGISAKQILGRLAVVGGDQQKIKGIFITHEHSDHITGADVLARKLNIPIFATNATINHGFLCSNKDLIQPINKNSAIQLGNLTIEAFSKSHHAADPVSYNIIEKKKVSVITDAGHACHNIRKHVADCDFLCIESNYDEAMLKNGPYPAFLKKWIGSDEGHLSNTQAAFCTLVHGSEKLKHVVLSHISQTNNTPEIALKTFSGIIRARKDLRPLVSASVREQPTELFRI